MTDEISDDVKRMAATIWMNRALAAEGRLIALVNALEEIIDVDTLISDGGKVHDHGPCAERAIVALAAVSSPLTPGAREP